MFQLLQIEEGKMKMSNYVKCKYVNYVFTYQGAKGQTLHIFTKLEESEEN